MSKRILHICPALDSGGIEQGTIDVAIATKAAGFEPLVMSSGGKMVNTLEKANIRHITHPIHLKSPFKIYMHAAQLANFIRDENIDLIHARSRAPIWVAAMATRKVRIPLVTGCHSPHGPGFMGMKKLYNAGVTYGDRVIAISEFIADYLKKDYRLTDDKIRIIHRGVDTGHFNPTSISTNEISALKASWKIPANTKIILLPGRITRWKGQHVLIESMKQLRSRNDCIAVLIGRVDSKEYYHELQDMMQKYDLTQIIKILPPSSEMPAVFAAADIVVSTSTKPEAFGRVVVEGQCMNKPVIATDIGATKETIIEGKTGYLIPPNDPTALANMLQRLLEKDNHQLTEQALNDLKTRFSKKAMCNKTIALYKELL